MSNRVLQKIQINGKELREEIDKAGYSLRMLGHEIGYSDRQIRTYLKENQMTKDMYTAIIDKIRPTSVQSKKNKNLIRRLNAQIAVAKEVDGDFVYITVGDAKRILKVLEKENLDGQADERLKGEKIGIIPDKVNKERQTNA